MDKSIENKFCLRKHTEMTEGELKKASADILAFILHDELNYFLRLVNWAIQKHCLDAATKLNVFNLFKLDAQQLEACSLGILKNHQQSVKLYAKMVNRSVVYVKEKEKSLN